MTFVAIRKYDCKKCNPNIPCENETKKDLKPKYHINTEDIDKAIIEDTDSPTNE